MWQLTIGVAVVRCGMYTDQVIATLTSAVALQLSNIRPKFWRDRVTWVYPIDKKTSPVTKTKLQCSKCIINDVYVLPCTRYIKLIKTILHATIGKMHKYFDVASAKLHCHVVTMAAYINKYWLTIGFQKQTQCTIAYQILSVIDWHKRWI